MIPSMRMTKEQIESLTPSERSERIRRQFQNSAIKRKTMGQIVPDQPYFDTQKASVEYSVKMTSENSNR